MATEVKIPNVGESITSANVARWHKQDGEMVGAGDILLTIETDKVSNDLEASVAGVLKILAEEGEEKPIGSVVALIEGSNENASESTQESESEFEKSRNIDAVDSFEAIEIVVPPVGESITSANVGRWHVAHGDIVSKGALLVTLETDKVSNELEAEIAGIVEIIVEEGTEVSIGAVIGKVFHEDDLVTSSQKAKVPTAQAEKVTLVAETSKSPSPSSSAASATVASANSETPALSIKELSAPIKPDFSVEPSTSERAGTPESDDDGRTTRKKMSMMRRKIATHLVGAQQTAAILTTFNEVDMSAIMKFRKDVQGGFIAKHGCKLGFMSFFVKAVVKALKEVPSINATIDGDYVVENHFYDIGVAIGSDKGLVVPVLRGADQKGFAEIEQEILDLAGKAQAGKIKLSDLQGGVFTISNGGVYGSLLSTPILNPPQSGILGMHTIQDRPVAVDGQVVIRPMMYLALSYDHRLVDGKEAVTFLLCIKDCLENPSQMMLGEEE